jgi:hypothetical protein
VKVGLDTLIFSTLFLIMCVISSIDIDTLLLIFSKTFVCVLVSLRLCKHKLTGNQYRVYPRHTVTIACGQFFSYQNGCSVKLNSNSSFES